MTELISIGIPFFNNASTILDSIRSVIAQDYQDWELILVDDGSTDSSFELVRGIDDPRIKVVSDTENKGLAVRLNEIAGIAKGRILARMDADDLMHPNRLSMQVEYLQNNPEIDIAGSGLYSIDRLNQILGIRRPSSDLFGTRRMLTYSPLAHPTVIGKTAWFRSNSYNDEYRRCQDQELWVRSRGHTNFGYVPDPLMFVREADTISASKYASSARATRSIIRSYGPESIGRLHTVGMILQTYGKEFVYRIFEKHGAVDSIVKRRNVPLQPADMAAARQVLASVLETTLPTSDHAVDSWSKSFSESNTTWR